MKPVLVLMLIAIVVHSGKTEVQQLKDTSMDTQREQIGASPEGLEPLQPEAIASKASNNENGIQDAVGKDLETAQSIFLGVGLGGFGGGYGGGYGGGWGWGGGGGYGRRFHGGHHHHGHHGGGYGYGGGWGWGK